MSFPGSRAAHDLTRSCVTLEPVWKGGPGIKKGVRPKGSSRVSMASELR